jgi:hypothetical protein
MVAVHRLVAQSIVICALGWITTGCSGAPTEPRDTSLFGQWSGDGACLSVADAGCNLTVGCGHGRFPRPSVRPGGTFDVDGTYRVEVGPIGMDPAPPAHFSGTIAGSVLRLTVVPTAPSLAAASYTLKPTASGLCGVLCL